MYSHIYCYRIEELCIKLVIWNKSILWCTAIKASNCVVFCWLNHLDSTCSNTVSWRKMPLRLRQRVDYEMLHTLYVKWQRLTLQQQTTPAHLLAFSTVLLHTKTKPTNLKLIERPLRSLRLDSGLVTWRRLALQKTGILNHTSVKTPVRATSV